MKYEWRKKDKQLYLLKQQPTIKNVGEYMYIVVEGAGDPNSDAFASGVEALYALSYGIKMAPRNGVDIPGYYDYTVFPLEGLWDLSEEGRERYHSGESIVDLKQYFTYRIMIRQPDFVTEELFKDRQQAVYKKKQNDDILQARLESIQEGLCCQMLHLGPYDDEPATFKVMENYIQEQGYRRLTMQHKEIYISDPRRTAPEQLKTTLRFYIEPIE